MMMTEFEDMEGKPNVVHLSHLALCCGDMDVRDQRP